jgi:SSS family solute:Na+ symporter
VGFALTGYMKTSSDLLTSSRSIPAWVTRLAFISANFGVLERVCMAASDAIEGKSFSDDDFERFLKLAGIELD